MKKNYHVAARSTPDPQLISELVEVEADLAEKRRLLTLKQQEAQKLQAQVPTNVMQFYDQPVPMKVPATNRVQQHRPAAGEDFFRKFDRNPNAQLEKKERWRKELEEQMQQNRNQKAVEVEETKKRQLADDIMDELLAARQNQLQNKPQVANSPPRQQQRKTEEPSEKNAEPVNRNKRGPVQEKSQFVNTFVREQDEIVRAKIREQKQKEHREFLEQQIKLEQLRKQQEKNLKKNKVEIVPDAYEPKRKGADPNGPPKKYDFSPLAPTLTDADYQLKEKELKNKLKKGLIALEEYEVTLKRLQCLKGTGNNKPTNQPPQRVERPIMEDKPTKQQAPQPFVQPPPRPSLSGRNDYLPSSQLSAVSMHQPSQLMTSQAPAQFSPMDPQSASNMANIQAFQLEFMKRMFEEMKELMRTNRMMDQQLLQEAVLRNMNLTMGTGMPGMMPGTMQAPMTPQSYDHPMQTAPHPMIATQTSPAYPQTQQRNLQPPPTSQIHPSQVSISRTELFEQSLEADQYQLPYISSNAKNNQAQHQQEGFYSRPPKIKAFKSFEYAEAIGASALELPSTSVFLTNPQAKQELKRLFDNDLAEYQKLQVRKEIEAAKAKNFKKQASRQQLQEAVDTKLKTEEPLVITPMDRHPPQLNPFRKPKPEQAEKKPSVQPRQQGSEKKTSQVARMMKECLDEPATADDLAEVRRQLFRGSNNPLAVANKHNEILEKYEYSQSANDNESLPLIIEQPSKVSQRDSQRPSSGSNAHSQWSVRQPPKLAPSNVEQQTIQSMEYESMRRPSNSPAKEALQLSRRQLKNMKKLKENVLLDFIVREGEKPNSLKQDVDDEIEQQIDARRESREELEHEQSATLVSQYEQSTQKPVEKHIPVRPMPPPKSPPRHRPSERQRQYERTLEERSVSKDSRESNLTSLQEARKRAKQSRPKEKKDGIVSMQAIEQLQNEMRRKDPVSGNDILLTAPPVLEPQLMHIRPATAKPKDSKQLLSMLDNMVEDQDDPYSQDFESYRSLSRPDGNRYKQRF